MRPLMLLLPLLLAATACHGPAPVGVPLVDLGVLELSDGVPSNRIYLGSGDNLVISAKSGGDGHLDLQVDFAHREADKQEHLASRRIRVVTGQPVEVSFQPYVRFTLTPKIKS